MHTEEITEGITKIGIEMVLNKEDVCALCAGNGSVYRRDEDGAYVTTCPNCCGSGKEER